MANQQKLPSTDKEQSSYVYIQSEPHLWTVGFYDPNGKWHSESDHPNTEGAADRVRFLNGFETKLIQTEQLLTDQRDIALQSLKDLLVWEGVIHPKVQLSPPELLSAAATVTATTPPAKEADEFAWETLQNIDELTTQHDGNQSFQSNWQNRVRENAVLAMGPLSSHMTPVLPQLHDSLAKCNTAFAAWQVGQIPGRPEDILALTQQVRGSLETADSLIPQREPWTTLKQIRELGADQSISGFRRISELMPEATWKNIASTQSSVALKALAEHNKEQHATGLAATERSLALSGWTVEPTERESGIYRGTILFATDQFFVQKLSQEKVVIHSNLDFATKPPFGGSSQPVPPAGEFTVSYAMGQASLKSTRTMQPNQQER